MARRYHRRMLRTAIVILLIAANACAPRERHPPVIVISIDTLRADHVSASATPHIDAFAREGIVFDDYDDAIGIVDGAPVGALQRAGEVSEAIAERWIAARGEKPFFFFLHLYEPHTPYTPTYEADVTHADRIVGKFLDFLRQRGLYDRTLIVLLSDHGEGLMDHGEQEHGVLLYRESLQVPLIVKPAGAREHREVDAPVALIDVMPTILELAGCPAPRVRGRSLVASNA